MCHSTPLDWISMSSVPGSLLNVARGPNLLPGPQDPQEQGQGQEAGEVQWTGQSHPLLARPRERPLFITV